MFARDLGSEVLNSKKQTNKQNPEILKLNTSPNQSGNEEKKFQGGEWGGQDDDRFQKV